MKRIGILFGGKSGEHEVSLLSAAAVAGAIDRNKYEVVMIGITRDGCWKRFSGSLEALPDGSWEKREKGTCLCPTFSNCPPIWST